MGGLTVDGWLGYNWDIIEKEKMNMELKITEHAKQRYAERIMDKNDKNEIAVFIANNTDKISEDISKMIEYGQLIYQGVSNHEFNKQPVKIYLKDTWVVIVDEKQNKVITLYSIDLGVGKEFNELYINKLLDKLTEAQNKYNDKYEEFDNRKKEYQSIIAENESTISEYRQTANSLEKQNVMYKGLIEELETSRFIAEKDVRDIVATLIGKNVF